MALKVLGARVLIKRDEAETMTTGGIYLPEQAQEKPRSGVVVAVGPGQFDDNGNRLPMDVKVGDRVIYASFSGTEVTDTDGQTYTLLNVRDILAIVEA